ncbi:MAG: hypothetical protein HY231_08160 [Acidobacteria bacterium]|nr:hypothetical protein [Acidobacteriota bacterium]
MNQMLLGAIAISSLIIGLFFLHSWKITRDRFFLFFALSFFIEGVNRIILGLSHYSEETEPFFYLVRFLSFVIILIAILDKNRKPTPPPDTESALSTSAPPHAKATNE